MTHIINSHTKMSVSIFLSAVPVRAYGANVNAYAELTKRNTEHREHEEEEEEEEDY